MSDLPPPDRPIHLIVPGQPLGWQRANPRPIKLADGTMLSKPFTPKKTRDAQAHIKLLAEREMGNHAPFDCAVEMVLTAFYQIPVSFSKRKRAQALAYELLPVVKPDLDNVEKLALDAMNGIVFRDDVLIVRVSKAKVYGERPRLAITVRPFRPERKGLLL